MLTARTTCKLHIHELRYLHIKKQGFIEYMIVEGGNYFDLTLGKISINNFKTEEELKNYVFFKLIGPLVLVNKNREVIINKESDCV